MLEILDYTDQAVEYVPDFANNRDLDDPMTVVVTPASARDLRRIEEANGKIGKGGINFVKRYNENRAEAVRKYVKSINRLVVRKPNGSPVSIKTAEELLAEKAIPDELIEDIFQAIKDASKLGEGERKKPSSQPASTSAVTAP